MKLKLNVEMKIAGVVAIVVALTGGAGVLFFPRQQIDAQTAALERKSVSLSRMVAHDVVAGSGLKDHEGIIEVFQGFSFDPDALYVVLFDIEGRVVAELGREHAEHDVRAKTVVEPTPARFDTFIEVTTPVTSASGSHGTLVTGFSMRSIDAEATRIWGTTVVAGGVIILLALGLAAFLGRGLAVRLRAIAKETETIAGGDLSRAALHDSSLDEIGRIARSFNSMVESQRELVSQIIRTALQLNTAAGQFLATAKEQERGSIEQSSAVEQTRRTLDALLRSGGEITTAAQGVLRNAEGTQQNGNVMAVRIGELSRQLERITEILEVIKGIASKSEILALNAALEGTKAGEAGRGFSLVAGQMQRLAENVMEAVRDIRGLTGDIREATQASVLATEETAKLSTDTTRSARQISLIIQQQQSATEQVADAMDDVSKIATQSASASKQIVDSSGDMLKLCERLQGLVTRFTIDQPKALLEGHGGA